MVTSSLNRWNVVSRKSLNVKEILVEDWQLKCSKTRMKQASYEPNIFITKFLRVANNCSQGHHSWQDRQDRGLAWIFGIESIGCIDGTPVMWLLLWQFCCQKSTITALAVMPNLNRSILFLVCFYSNLVLLPGPPR